MGDSIFVDANIPMYAHGADHPYRASCRASLKRIVDDDLSAATSTEVIQEIIHRYLSQRRPKLAVQVASDLIILIPKVLPVTEKEIKRALELVPRYPELPARDLIHGAVMFEAEISRILSTDTHFDMVDALTRIDPKDFACIPMQIRIKDKCR